MDPGRSCENYFPLILSRPTEDSDVYSKILSIRFPRTVVNEPVVVNLVKKFDLSFNILKATIYPRKEGLMVLELSGHRKNFQRGVRYLRGLGVKVENIGQDIKRDNVVLSRGINVDCFSANRWGERAFGEKQAQEVIHQQGVRVNQATTASLSNILKQAIFKELGLAFARQANHIHMGSAVFGGHTIRGEEIEPSQSP